MNDNPTNQNDMVDTTDCLEAVSVFRGWKNILFVVVLLCLLAIQAAFWLVDLGVIEAPAAGEGPGNPVGTIEEAAAATVADANAADANAADAQGEGFVAGLLGGFDYEYLAHAVGLVNGILVAAAVLFCLTLFMSLMISLVGRLGGINHVSRAFMLSLIMLVLIIPWQTLGLSVFGVVWTPAELSSRLPAKSENVWNLVIYYLRFTGYWLIVVLLLLLSQARSARWSKAILRRLEII